MGAGTASDSTAPIAARNGRSTEKARPRRTAGAGVRISGNATVRLLAAIHVIPSDIGEGVVGGTERGISVAVDAVLAALGKSPSSRGTAPCHCGV